VRAFKNIPWSRSALLAGGQLIGKDRLVPAEVTIRSWKPHDRVGVHALLRLLSESAVVASDDAPTYVADTVDGIVGTVTLCVFATLTGPKAYLDHLVVAPGCGRQGIGRALVQHAIAEAKAAGASRVDLTAGEQKEAGHALYRSLGFRERETTMFRLDLAARRGDELGLPRRSRMFPEDRALR
jgi:ribosomal protein S18 acetylase RimI-like enzyme